MSQRACFVFRASWFLLTAWCPRCEWGIKRGSKVRGHPLPLPIPLQAHLVLRALVPECTLTVVFYWLSRLGGRSQTRPLVERVTATEEDYYGLDCGAPDNTGRCLANPIIYNIFYVGINNG